MNRMPPQPPSDIAFLRDILAAFDDDFIFVYDAAGSIRWCNSQVLRVLKLSWPAISRIKIFNMIVPNPGISVKRYRQRFFKKGVLGEVRIVKVNGGESRQDDEEEAFNVRNIDEESFGVGVRCFIHPLKKDRFLLLTKIYYHLMEKTLASFSKDCLVLVDRKDNIVGYSREFVEMATENIEKIVGQPVWKYISRHDWETYKKNMSDAEAYMRRLARLSGESWRTVFTDDFKTRGSLKNWLFDKINSWEIRSGYIRVQFKRRFGFALVEHEIPQYNKDIKATVEFEFRPDKNPGHFGVIFNALNKVVDLQSAATPDMRGYMITILKNGYIQIRRAVKPVFLKKLSPFPLNKKLDLVIARIGGLIRIYINDHLLGEYVDIDMIHNDRLNFCGLCVCASVHVHKVRFETRPSSLDFEKMAQLASVNFRFNRDMQEIYMPHVSKNYQNITGIDAYLLTQITKEREIQRELERHMALLQKTNWQLEMAISEKQDFMRAISHDLGAPLRNIRGMLELLQQEMDAAVASGHEHRFQRILANVQRAEDLISDIMTLSSIKMNRVPFETVSIEELVRNILQELAYDLEDKNITVHQPPQMPSLYCEKSMIVHIFRNLLDNAVKYIGANNPRPVITIGYQEEEERHLFYIKDNGIGIRKEDQDRIFFAFRRIQSQETRNVPGKGLGLSIVRIILENYKGSVWVHSSEGQGATFYFTLSKAVVQPENASHDVIASAKAL